MLRRSAIAALFAALGCGGSNPPAADPTSTSTPTAQSTASSTKSGDPELQKALDGPQRSAESRARDKYRHPAETLAFFGLRPDMTVVELYPGGGWYTEILAPYLAAKGKLIITGSRAVAERIEKEPTVFGKVELKRLDPPNDFTLAPAGSVDLVLTFRNVHNWMQAGYAEKVFAAAFKALKKGGTFGVVEHRAKPGTTEKQSAESGYVAEDTVLDYAKKAGFELAARSEINANPSDTKDHPGGVWALPPVLANKDTDRAKYLAIGESDRMTLRFKKP
jgi:predicted methyltransferase